MCGLFASIGLRPRPAAIEAVAHRGPDGQGWHEFQTPAGPVALGHRRLAIIDTSPAGAQPMASPDGRRWLVYNGEIYNFIELRQELEELGHRFRTRTDSEVVLAAHAQWGPACLNRFNGMFALVIIDLAEGRVFAARDRFGVKPLYWWHGDHGGIALASEVKQFAVLDGFRPALDEQAAHHFLTGGLIDHDTHTFFAGVRQLRGGECLSLPLSAGAKPTIERWYARPRAGSLDLPASTAVEQVRTLLEDSVRLRLRSDVAVGSCLSGGLDSSAIVCLAARHTRSPMVTVSACYDDRRIDERHFIDIVNAARPTRPVAVFPQAADLPGLLDRLVWHQDGPFGSTSVFAQYCVFEAARREGVPVMLDGQGADEQLCGYLPAFTAFHAQLLRGLEWRRLAAELAGQRHRHQTGLAAQAMVLARAVLPESWRRGLRKVRGLTAPHWLAPGFVAAHTLPLPAVASLEDLIESQLFDTSLPMLLHYEDRNSMAHGIEARLPFLDYRLVELLVGLGSDYKLVDGETKWLLRRAMSGILPDAIRDRQDKIGFATPEKTWLAGDARALIPRVLTDAADILPGLFNHRALAAMAEAVLTGRQAFDFSLWRVISFCAWARVAGIGGSR